MVQANNEPRALAAALAAPVPFRTAVGTNALTAADRHVGRYAPEADATRKSRSLGTLSFVDRLISPWVVAAHQSASLRLFGDVAARGLPERAGSQVSWVFPRPWYQDELDWMAAARDGGPMTGGSLFTTRGTFEAKQPAPRTLAGPTPASLEYVAPSLIGDGGGAASAWSPLVGADEVNAAQLVAIAMSRRATASEPARAEAPSGARAAMTAMAPAIVPQQTPGRLPSLQARLAAMLSPGAAMPGAVMPGDEAMPSQLAARVPDMVVHAPVDAGSEATAAGDAFGAPMTRVAAQTQNAPTNVDELRRVAARAEAQRVIETQRAQRAIAEARRDEAQRAVETRRAELAQAAPAAPAQPIEAPAQPIEAPRVEAQRVEAQRVAEAQRVERATAERAALVAEQAQVADQQRAFVAEMRARETERAVEAQRQAQAHAAAGGDDRMVELIAHSVEHGHGIAPVAGPRVAMPAGLGGLLAGTSVSGAVASIAGRQTATAARPMTRLTVPGPDILRLSNLPETAAVAGEPARASRAAPAQTFALPAVIDAKPQVLSHVAWADRWLGRLAGASPQALASHDRITSPTAHPMLGRAASAPEVVFVAPDAPRILDQEPEAYVGAPRPATAPVSAAPAPAPVAKPVPISERVLRFDDADETPDEIFLAIAAARAQPSRPSQAAAAAPAATMAPKTPAPISRPMPTPADHVMTSVPLAPSAGLAPSLAASPMAPALASILPLPAVSPFDVRALFGANLAAAYLAGDVAATTALVDDRGVPQIGSRFSPATSQAAAQFADSRLAAFAPSMDVVAPAPDIAPIGDDTAPAYARHAEPAAMTTTLRASLLAPQPAQRVAAPTTWQPGEAAVPTAHDPMPAIAAMPSYFATDASGDLVAPSVDAFTPSTMTMVEEPLWSSRPGMTAERSRRWATRSQVASSDLALDFVSPELVLAARAYGLSPADASQAARLTIGGPSGLQALATSVEMTFLRALSADADLRAAQASSAAIGGPAASSPRTASIADYTPASPAPASTAPSAAPSSMPIESHSFMTSAVPPAPRRSVRGAFLWPAASVGALGLRATALDGDNGEPLSIAALELLAANAVAQLGTYAIAQGASTDDVAGLVARGAAIPSHAPAAARAAMPTIAGTAVPHAGAAPGGEIDVARVEADAIASGAATMPTAAARARFEALYVALSQSTVGQGMSPAARAARALALVGRGDNAPATAVERAALAWSVMPVVSPSDLSGAGDVVDSPDSTAPGAPRAAYAPEMTTLAVGPEAGPDVRVAAGGGATASLAARAGHALASYVTPLDAPAAPTASSSSSSSGGMASRAPTAAPELVRTARSGRYGGGEVEIPGWFESAARKMLAERGTGDDGISLAELTLVTAAASNNSQIAASSRAGGVGGASTIPTVNTVPAKPGMPDVEKLAQEVYSQVLAMFDSVRWRNNGEP